MAEAWDAYPFDAWAAGLLTRIGPTRGGAADHPFQIVGQRVGVDDAIDIARRAFLALVGTVSRAGSSFRIYFVVDLDEQTYGEGPPLELTVPFLRSVLVDDMSIAIGASTPEATFQGCEVEETPICQSVFDVTSGSLRARIRRLRYPDDESWAVSAEISWSP